MPKMTETEIQQKIAEGWRWGESGLNPKVLYHGSMDDGRIEALDPSIDHEQEEADEKARIDAIRAMPTAQEAEELGRALYLAVATSDHNFVLATWYDHRRRLAIKNLHGDEIGAVKFKRTIGLGYSER